MAVRTVIKKPVPELSTFRYQTDLKKDDEATPLPEAEIDTLTLTISDLETGAIVNGVQDTPIKNTDRGTVDANGHLTVISQINDTAILDPSKNQEKRLLTFKVKYAGNARATNHEVLFTIPNMPKVA